MRRVDAARIIAAIPDELEFSSEESGIGAATRSTGPVAIRTTDGCTP